MQSGFALPFLAMAAAFAIMLGAGIVLAVRAFRISTQWGITVLLPFGVIVFLIRHWNRGKAPFGVLLVSGTLGAVFAGVSNPSLLGGPESRIGNLVHQWVEDVSETPASLTEEINQLREGIASSEITLRDEKAALHRDYSALGVRRNGLSKASAEQVSQFHHDLDDYKRRLAEYNAAETQLSQRRGQLHELLEKRSKMASREPAKAAGGNRVVLLTTPTCGACRMAKSYLASRGIPYTEHDVTTSEYGRQQMQRLGARGVPVVIIGDRHSVGFSSRWIEQQLAGS